VKHPGAVWAIDDDVAEDGTAFIVMELLEGDSVEGLAEASGGRLSLEAITAIMLQALEVLEAAH
jgi:serine/threonine-protein kinase